MKRPSLRTAASAVVRQLQKHGFDSFWVGGCVRDFLLGRTPGDYDIATAALPAQIEKLFKRTIPVGRKFGVIIVLESGHQIQVATFRAEADYQDGRRPERVVFADAKADALRRDFTINGLFYDPVRRELHDWVGGEADLRQGIIRTIGAPAERFGEDHLRLLRAVRLAARLGFEIESDTFAAVRACAPSIKRISPERIRDELIKLFAPPSGTERAARAQSVPALTGGHRDNELPMTNVGKRGPRNWSLVTSAATGGVPAPASRGLELLYRSGLLEQVLPELAATVDCAQSPDYHPEGSVFNHLRLMLEHLPPDADPLLPWAVLLHDIAKPRTASTDPQTGAIHFYGHEKLGAEIAEQILGRLRFPRKQIEAIVKAVRYHMQFKDAPQMRKATLRRLLLRPTFPLELELHRLDCLGSHGLLDVYDFLVREARDLKKQPQIIPPLLRGDDLIAMGMKPGPAMGVLLAELREKQLQDELKTKVQARKWAKERLSA